ncbi:hypothetical protein PMAYCL1PPCAC_04368, partial [Pristionchus mayeri]
APASIHNYFHLSRVDENVIKSEGPHMAGSFAMDRVYGGLSATQALTTFKMLHPSLYPHTINCKYVAAASIERPIEYYSSHFDEGKVLAVQARQGTTVVGSAHIRYSNEIDLLPPLQYPFPEGVQGPEEYLDARVVLKELGREETLKTLSQLPLSIHPVESPLFPSSDDDRVCLWLRFAPQYHDDLQDVDGMVTALFLFDFNILQVAGEIYQKNRIKFSAAASLHHTVWFHQLNLDPRDWYLTVVEAPVIAMGRPQLRCHLFDRTRNCVLSAVQEGFVKRSSERSKM